MQTNRTPAPHISPAMSTDLEAMGYTEEDLDELASLLEPHIRDQGTWRAWLCCCLRCIFPCICCVEACHAYRVSKRVQERVVQRAAQSSGHLAP